MEIFPSMKARKLLSVLLRKPLLYRITRQVGSHRKLESPNYRTIRYSYHDAQELSGIQVRKVLVNDVGLTYLCALEVLQ